MLSDAISLISNNLDLGILFIPLVVALLDGKPSKQSSSTKSNTYSNQELRANTEAMRRLSNVIDNSKYKL